MPSATGTSAALSQSIRRPASPARSAPSPAGDLSTRRRRLLATWIPVCVPLVIVLVGAWQYRWVADDAFIDFRVIANLLAGHGPVYNVGERVEVYSDPLWLFTLAGLHATIRFIPLEWLSVMLGLGCTAVAMVLAGRAIQRLGASRGQRVTLPVGLLVFSVVAGVWEFVTSGLEMGMAFAWIAVCFWLLVRTEERRDSAVWAAFAAGLGPLIRPEFVLMAGVDLVALGVVVAAPGWRGSPRAARRWALPLAAAAALPLAYQLFRMAYFGLAAPNTALAKSAAGSWWSQGFAYAWNLVGPYWLWLPLLLGLALVGALGARWWRGGDRIGALVLAAPVVGAALDAGYIVKIGGDYMHARLLLPALFSLCMVVHVDAPRLRSMRSIALAVVVVWAVVCASTLRFDGGSFFAIDAQGISNERNFWIDVTGVAHPVTAQDFRRSNPYREGVAYRQLASQHEAPGDQLMLVVPLVGDDTSTPIAASSPLPFDVAVDAGAIGVLGYVSGPRVYVFDSLSLANPVGAHVVVTLRLRPGHDQVVSVVWMVGRFGRPDATLSGAVTPAATAAARRALGCGPLGAYLHAITTPLTPALAWHDVLHAFGWTTLRFDDQPQQAVAALCG